MPKLVPNKEPYEHLGDKILRHLKYLGIGTVTIGIVFCVLGVAIGIILGVIYAFVSLPWWPWKIVAAIPFFLVISYFLGRNIEKD